MANLAVGECDRVHDGALEMLVASAFALASNSNTVPSFFLAREEFGRGDLRLAILGLANSLLAQRDESRSESRGVGRSSSKTFFDRRDLAVLGVAAIDAVARDSEATFGLFLVAVARATTTGTTVTASSTATTTEPAAAATAAATVTAANCGSSSFAESETTAADVTIASSSIATVASSWGLAVGFTSVAPGAFASGLRRRSETTHVAPKATALATTSGASATSPSVAEASSSTASSTSGSNREYLSILANEFDPRSATTGAASTSSTAGAVFALATDRVADSRASRSHEAHLCEASLASFRGVVRVGVPAISSENGGLDQGGRAVLDHTRLPRTEVVCGRGRYNQT